MAIDPFYGQLGGAAIGAGADLIGGLIGADAANSARNEANRIQQNQFHEQFQWQKQLAMMGITMKVADAKAAGIHPLYALGATPAMSAPITAGAISDMHGGDTLARSFSGAGQNIRRAVEAATSKASRDISILTTERAHIENENLRKDGQIKDLTIDQLRRRGQVGPGVPIPGGGVSSMGQGNVPGVGPYESKPPEIPTHQPGDPSLVSGPTLPYVQFARSGEGLTPMYPKHLPLEDEAGAPLSSRWLLYVASNPEEFRPTQAQVDAAYGKGYSREELIWVPTAFHWRPYDMMRDKKPGSAYAPRGNQFQFFRNLQPRESDRNRYGPSFPKPNLNYGGQR